MLLITGSYNFRLGVLLVLTSAVGAFHPNRIIEYPTKTTLVWTPLQVVQNNGDEFADLPPLGDEAFDVDGGRRLAHEFYHQLKIRDKDKGKAFVITNDATVNPASSSAGLFSGNRRMTIYSENRSGESAGRRVRLGRRATPPPPTYGSSTELSPSGAFSVLLLSPHVWVQALVVTGILGLYAAMSFS